eukprot:CAMPEP_0201555706 /NCGR_PEP_ID=MMETSP0173_2-20130828/50697_1 /ASSEMBLY_ACC=CAM_ASM_000268 /TAXON_ID=218659 /ORGANISM="Vexillifera sp., Strain DIVA3 564/2" /LENGTH=86 /DNA_ID=CAMNT_0047967627 /DNA_START=343 /DNA_END=600 /DNA_ORIENTATION=-
MEKENKQHEKHLKIITQERDQLLIKLQKAYATLESMGIDPITNLPMQQSVVVTPQLDDPVFQNKIQTLARKLQQMKQTQSNQLVQI